MRYGEEWRRHRKLTHMALNSEAVKKYDSIGDIAAKYVASLLDNPDDFERDLRVTLGRVIMAVTYGIPVDTPDDLVKFTTHGTLSQFLTHAERTMRTIVKATVPGTFLVDLIPGLKYLPAWVPFNDTGATAARERTAILSLITHPYEYVKRERQRGTNRPSFTSDCLDKYQSDDLAVQADVEHTILWAAGTLYGGGVETTYSTTLNFILALALYPDVQVKLNEEFTRVVGTERLPTLQDRDSLPYLCAAIEETLRWRPAAPLSIARATRSADFYRGYYIPEGTIVVPNLWAMSRDDKSGFPPDEFVPERHLVDKVKDIAVDPHTYVFGFGRRICPGKHLADNVLFMLFSHIVAIVHVSKKKDADGNDIPLNPSCTTDGLVICPNPFEVDIRPHSQKAISNVKKRVSQFA
ncbi:cytochrome P450 [Chiua virens]|nr:cytochrome P450 [Chiua virens]